MKKLEVLEMEVVNAGGNSCEATVNGLFWFGATLLPVPGWNIVGAVSMTIAAGAWAFGGCGKR
ncbi:hypothetical protein [Runella slithyformis]|uniref:hypothetical protein n=1 Tax=Runella slithyformis TaxID=106 RepID=UPI00059DDD88|nr:hypothetical protein [Runella slithyformis]